MLTLISRRNFIITGVAAATATAWPSFNSAETTSNRNDVARIVKAWLHAYQNIAEPDKMLDLLANDISFEDPTFRLRHEGRESMRKMVEEAAAGFQQVKIEPSLVVIDPPWAAMQTTISGILKMADTFATINVRGATFLMIEKDKIKKWTDYYDYRTYNEQLKRGPVK